MKACPNCRAVWADEHVGPCVECGNPMAGVEANGGLGFAFARQIQAQQAEASLELQLRGARTPQAQADVYNRAPVHDAVLSKAHEMIVQREEVRYEDD